MQTKEKMENITEDLNWMIIELRDNYQSFYKKMKQFMEMELTDATIRIFPSLVYEITHVDLPEEAKEIIKKMENIKRIQDTENKYALFYISHGNYEFIGIIDLPTTDYMKIAEEMAKEHAKKYEHSFEKNNLYEGSRGEELKMDKYVLEKIWNINEMNIC